ncbi:MAG: hypothetical protein HKN32_02745 [Flavobacteriales bacterium]|nr:hypothetical protein [Flavobacteriales bacterium]
MALQGDASKAEAALTQLEIASNLKGSASHVTANMGAAYMIQMEYDQAYGALSDASTNDNTVNAKVNSMKGALETKNADYEAAKTSFGAAQKDGKSNINKGLAYLLTKDYTQANNAFDAAKKDEGAAALAYYLSAVTAARQGDAALVQSNLAESVKANADMKQMALNDLEFRNFADQVAAAVR